MLTNWRIVLQKCFLIPQRYVLSIMGFLAVVNAYNMRICLSVAITAMTRPMNMSSVDAEDSCPSFDEHHQNSTAPVLGDYDWDSGTQGLILGSFFWGYVITHMPGGVMAERFGGKHSLGLGILCTAVFTLLTPIIVEYGGWKWLVVVRVLQGLGEGTTFPALNTLLAQWVPPTERAKLGTLVYSGSQVGTILGTAVSGALISATGSWQSVFYFFGGIAIVWFLLWCLICYSSPHTHPFISTEEKSYLDTHIEGRNKEDAPSVVPWRAIFCSAPLWALVAAQIGHDWGFFAMVTDLPKYMSEILHFRIKENGILSSVPYIVMWMVSISSGCICDWLIHKGYFSVSFARKFFTTVASVGPAVFLVAASYAGCERNTVVALFCIGMGTMGTFYPGMKVNALDLAPNFAGTIMAIVNGIGALTGIVVPILIGYLTNNHTLSEWRLVFWICFIVFILTNIIYVIFGSAEEQNWNKIEKKEDVENKLCEKYTVQDVKSVCQKELNHK